ncbi:MAG TPA: hypothetical protein VNS58_15705 [Puia sp.]|nr:hypothetical protein [Puia sp.]
MKPFLSAIFFIICLIACSPYKKIVLSASERLTKNWKGASEATVNTSYGSYKKKIIVPDGYLLSFDYSYALKSAPIQSSNFQVKASNQPSSPMLPRATDSYSNQKGTADSVIKRVDFFFDKSQRVQYVEAIGFPDSVYYVKRK